MADSITAGMGNDQKKKRPVVDSSEIPLIAGEGAQSAALVLTKEVAELNTLLKVSHELHKAGMFPHLRNAGQVLAIILAGRERGYQAMTSLMNIHIVNGRPGFSGQMIAGELEKAGVVFHVVESNTEHCIIEFSQPNSNRKSLTHKWTSEDAERAGKLPGKPDSVWRTYPQEMLYWRCLTSGARRFAPHAIMGIYLTEELEAVTHEWTMKDAVPANIPNGVDPTTKSLNVSDMSPGDPADHQGYEPESKPRDISEDDSLEDETLQVLMKMKPQALVIKATTELAEIFPNTSEADGFLSRVTTGADPILGNPDFQQNNNGQLARFIIKLRKHKKPSTGEQTEAGF